MMYVGVQDQFYTFTMFDAQARWAVKYMTGNLDMPAKKEQEEDMAKWRSRYLEHSTIFKDFLICRHLIFL